MKPKEFDELIRQKFDQNDFAYDSRNWENLAEQLDGRAKKRSMIMWWLMPIAGVAASIALAMGVPSLLRQSGTGDSGAGEAYVRTYHTEQQPQQPVQELAGKAAAPHAAPYKKAIKNTHKNITRQKTGDEEDGFAINYMNAVGNSAVSRSNTKNINLADVPDPMSAKGKKKQQAATDLGYRTFKPENGAVKKAPPTLSVILSGGISHGNENSGYMAAATIRKMINDKVFIESAVGFASSNNTQSTEVLVTQAKAAKHAAGKSTATESGKGNPVPVYQPLTKEETQSYDLNYAQVSPSLGYLFTKKISVGVGPDFQQMLADNRPAASAVDKSNQAVAPLFDVGFIGKTEYSISRTVKAGVSYRKGINNVLTPMDKYIDRDYLQFQVKCAIFNK